MLYHLLSLLVLPQAIEPPPRFERLENGLRVAIVEEHALPLVSVQLWYRVGSASDAIEQPGLCHVTRTILEHRDDAALKLRAAGVRFESRTLRDACYFSSVLPPNFLEYVLDIEAARMRPLAVTPEMTRRGVNAATYRTAYRSGLRATRDFESDRMRALLAAMFPDHPYRHPPELVAQSLADLSAEEVNEYLERWFVPGNATLFVFGDVSTVRALDLVRERLGKLEWAEPPRRAAPGRLESEMIRRELPEKGTARALIAWQTPPLGYFENAAIDVLMHGLLNEFDGPLYEAMRKAGLRTFTPQWSRHAWRDAGLLIIGPAYYPTASPASETEKHASTPVRVAAEYVRLVELALTDAESRIPSEIAHNRARALAGRDVSQRLLALGDRAREQARHELLGGDLLLTEFLIARIRHVGVSDVQAAARLLNRSRRVVIDTVADLPTADQTESLSPLIQPLLAVEPRHLDATNVLALLREHTQAAPKPITPSKHPRIERASLGDRIPITACKIPGMPRAVVALVNRNSSESRRVLIVDARQPALQQPPHVLERMLDYSAYHGVTRYEGLVPYSSPSVGGGKTVADVALTEPARVPAMLEWFGRLIPYKDSSGRLIPHRNTRHRLRLPTPNLEIFSVGNVGVDDLIEVGGPLVLSVYGSQATTASIAPANEAQSAPPPPTRVPRPLRFNIVTVRRCDQPSVAAPAVAELWIRWFLGQQTPPPSSLEIRVLTALLGRLPLGVETLGGRATSTWRRWSFNDVKIAARAAVEPARLEPTARALHARLDAIRNETVPPDELATALRLAQVEQLVRLDGPVTVLEALLWQEGDPWQIDRELMSTALARRLAEVASGSIELSVLGADETTLERLRLEFSTHGADQTPRP